ncbi:MAG: creatininase family protein [Sphaerochaeta sp.]
MDTENYDMALMTSAIYRKAMEKAGKLIVPVASVEVLGNHGPLGADWMVSGAVVPGIAQRAHALFAPSIPYGDTLELPQASGTVNVSQQVLQEYYEAVARSFLQDGLVKQLFFLNFHSLNNRALDTTCRRLAHDGYSTYVLDWWKAVNAGTEGVLTDRQWGTGHGGEMITSVILYLYPDSVQMDAQDNALPLEQFGYYRDHFPGTSSPFAAYGTFSDYCAGASWGDLEHASAAKGKVLVERAIGGIVEFIDSAKWRHER